MTKIALITGGSNGIGEAICNKFLEEGYNVINIDKESPNIIHDKYIYISADITEKQSIEKISSQVEHIDVLVNNVGLYLCSGIKSISRKELTHTFETNLFSNIFLTQALLPLLKKSKGSIINISSALSQKIEPESFAYGASKSALNYITKSLAKDLAKDGVRCNAILPGPIDTQLLHSAFNNKDELKEYLADIPMQSMGEPKDVADLAFIVAHNKYMTGGLYNIDGGEAL